MPQSRSVPGKSRRVFYLSDETLAKLDRRAEEVRSIRAPHTTSTSVVLDMLLDHALATTSAGEQG